VTAAAGDAWGGARANADAEVVVVGGGPAGAMTAALLARRGRAVVVLERSPAYRWRACGVFASPAAVVALRSAGLDEAVISQLARPIPAMRVEAAGGATFRLTYGDHDRLVAPAVGFDRSALDPALLDLARSSGADVRVGAAVASVDGGEVRLAGGDVIRARVVVGADGLRSVVARGFGVVRPASLAPRVGLTFHVADPSLDRPRDARMIVFDGGYVGLAPVPGGRVNVGIVLGDRWLRRLRQQGAEAVVGAVLAAIPAAPDDPVDWARAERCDSIEGAAPLGVGATRRAGAGWLVVGDAAGFLDPFTGEGLHRALVSARLAAAAVHRALDGDPDAMRRYDRAMTARFRSKDAVSMLVQGFLAVPELFDYAARRLAARDRVRETMGLVMGDLVPASRALDPRYIVALLRP
jgi:flavin-dependent dehydrogenase